MLTLEKQVILDLDFGCKRSGPGTAVLFNSVPYGTLADL